MIDERKENSISLFEIWRWRNYTFDWKSLSI